MRVARAARLRKERGRRGGLKVRVRRLDGAQAATPVKCSCAHCGSSFSCENARRACRPDSDSGHVWTVLARLDTDGSKEKRLGGRVEEPIDDLCLEDLSCCLRSVALHTSGECGEHGKEFLFSVFHGTCHSFCRPKQLLWITTGLSTVSALDGLGYIRSLPDGPLSELRNGPLAGTVLDVCTQRGHYCFQQRLRRKTFILPHLSRSVSFGLKQWYCGGSGL